MPSTHTLLRPLLSQIIRQDARVVAGHFQGSPREIGALHTVRVPIDLWADRFDGSLEDVFDLQDKVASSVAGAIEPALQAAEIACSSRCRPTNDLTAYDLYLRAYAIILSSTKQIPDALRLLEQAIERDPQSPHSSLGALPRDCSTPTQWWALPRQAKMALANVS